MPSRSAFFSLPIGGLARAEVGDGGGHQQQVAGRELARAGVGELGGRD